MPDSTTAAAAAPNRDPRARDRAIRCLWQLGDHDPAARQGYLYAVLDAARDERIFPGLRRLAAATQVISLYQGKSERELAAVAPYLVCLGTDDVVFDWIWRDGWGADWGIFLWSIVTLETLRAHLRRLTMVRTQEGQRLLFRFYDPRVLRQFAPSCDAAQARELFGPVTRFMIEDPTGEAILSFVHRNNSTEAAVGTTIHPLHPAPEG